LIDGVRIGTLALLLRRKGALQGQHPAAATAAVLNRPAVIDHRDRASGELHSSAVDEIRRQLGGSAGAARSST